jgi:hypothetical protein
MMTKLAGRETTVVPPHRHHPAHGRMRTSHRDAAMLPPAPSTMRKMTAMAVSTVCKLPMVATSAMLPRTGIPSVVAVPVVPGKLAVVAMMPSGGEVHSMVATVSVAPLSAMLLVTGKRGKSAANMTAVASGHAVTTMTLWSAPRSAGKLTAESSVPPGELPWRPRTRPAATKRSNRRPPARAQVVMPVARPFRPAPWPIALFGVGSVSSPIPQIRTALAIPTTLAIATAGLGPLIAAIFVGVLRPGSRAIDVAKATFEIAEPEGPARPLTAVTSRGVCRLRRTGEQQHHPKSYS